MIKVKANYKNGFPDQTCRACNDQAETQNHVLNECKMIHPNAPAADNGSSNPAKTPDNTDKDLDNDMND